MKPRSYLEAIHAPKLKPARFSPLRIVFALAGALLLLNLISAAFGAAPIDTLRGALVGTWGTGYGIGQVLFKATPLMFTGLAFHVALRAGMFNIGAEGQLALASLAGAWVGTKLAASTPWWLALPIVIAVAVTTGGLYAAIAGAMRARLGVHEIISTIMLNRCAEVLLPWMLVALLGASDMRTADVIAPARVAGLDNLASISGLSWLDAFRGSAASAAFPLAVAITFGCFAWLKRSRAGREMRWIGLGAEACEAQGVNVAKRRIQAMVLSGALAGCAISATVLGYKHYYELGLGAGAGFSGIAVAMVGRSGPVALVAAALLFGTLAQGGLAINATVPREAMGVLEAVVILLVAAAAIKSGDDSRNLVASAPAGEPGS